jgi:hypothetical protein
MLGSINHLVSVAAPMYIMDALNETENQKSPLGFHVSDSSKKPKKASSKYLKTYVKGTCIQAVYIQCTNIESGADFKMQS